MYKRDEPISVLPEHLARATRSSGPDGEGSAPEGEIPHSEEPPPPVTSCVRRKDRYFNGCRKPCIIMFTWFAGLRSGTPHWFAPQKVKPIPSITLNSADGMKWNIAEQTVRTLYIDRRARTKKGNSACRADSHLSATFVRPKNRQRLVCGARRCSGRSRIRNSRRNFPCPRSTVTRPTTGVGLANPACKEVAQETETSQGGCRHYKRNCVLKAECCERFYSCRFCHDEASDHGDMDRFATKEVSCTKCGTEQPVSNKCVNGECGNSLMTQRRVFSIVKSVEYAALVRVKIPFTATNAILVSKESSRRRTFATRTHCAEIVLAASNIFIQV
jgi:uncharacterized CHY-type Zn-finger protein